MARKYVTVLGTQYNKKGLGAKWSEVVASYEVGVTVGPEDFAFITDILQRIPRFSKVLARGKSVYRVVNKRFNGKIVKGVVLVTPNSGYEVWVGKKVVIDAMFPPINLPDPAKQNRRDALRAMRGIIEPQIQQYRRRFAGKSVIKSSLTGKPILGPYHVDHVYPFVRLVEEWCRERGHDLETIPVKCRGASCRFESVDMANDWFDYHAFHAEFQVLDASENTSKGSRYFGRSKDSVE